MRDLGMGLNDPRWDEVFGGRRLRMQADWGLANFNKVCNWIAHSLYFRVGRAGLCEIRTGQGWRDNMEVLSAGEVDLALTTPPVIARHAVEGIGMFDKPHPNLRSLAVLPHDDAVIFGIHAESPINSLQDILDQRYPLKLATAPNEGNCGAGWICNEILTMAGITPEKIDELGGRMFFSEFPRDCPSLVLSNDANALMNEAMMVPPVWDLFEKRPMRLLDIPDEIIDALVEKYGFARRLIRPGRFPGQTEPIATIDFSNWIVMVTDAMSEELAYYLTATMVEERQLLERQYDFAPVHKSPLTYPIVPRHMSIDTEVELHPGAARYYRERGLL